MQFEFPLKKVMSRSHTKEPPSDMLASSSFMRLMGDISGAFADLGTFLPLVLGVLAINQFNPASVLVCFGCFALATAAIYRRPVPVQPMKAVAAVVIATGLTAESVAATGIILGAMLITVALTGALERINQLLPQSVISGVSLGIGLHLGFAGLHLIARDWVIGLCILLIVLVILFTRFSAFACLVALAISILWGIAIATDDLLAVETGLHLPTPVIPSLDAFYFAAETVVIPQFTLTITNAILATAAISSSFFPRDSAQNITPRRLALSTGWLNLLLAPFGALPMCHGSGGLVAQYKFGARTGMAPAVFGLTCLGAGIFFGNGALQVLGFLPLAAVGAMLTVAGGEMALNKRLFDGRPSCLTVIFSTAAVCVLVNVAVGVVAGLAAELIRSAVMRRFNNKRTADY